MLPETYLAEVTRPRWRLSRFAARTFALVCGALLPALVHANPPLPVPSSVFVTSGAANAPVVAGQTMNIQQLSPSATFNWDSFNIAREHAVRFEQPDSSSIALNLINQADPSIIRGSLTATGEVWLLNRNGIVFGEGSEVDVRGLIASSLSITDDALANGIAPPNAQVSGSPAFRGNVARDGTPESGAVRVERGAQIRTNGPNGRAFLFAPEVSNEGTITANDGQVALAAGSEILIRQPGEGQGSGLIIEVGKGGTLTNGSSDNAGETDPAKLIGQVVADRGTATLVGLSVNQLGRVSASSAVRQGGRIRLLARESVALPGTPQLLPTRGGQLTLGENSVTAANPDLAETTLAVDASPVLRGEMELTGKTVELQQNSLLQSKGGDISITANDSGNELLAVMDVPANSESRILARTGSRVDVSGTDATAQTNRNFLKVKLQGAELKDRPEQRTGVLRGTEITVDLRRAGILADGTPWTGTPLADLREAAAAGLYRTNAERHSVGGSVNLATQGAILLEQGSLIDVSGGVVHHSASTVGSSLVMIGGRLLDIAEVDPGLPLQAVLQRVEVQDRKWGQGNSWDLFVNPAGDAYTEGKDAGSLTMNAPRMFLGGDVRGSVLAGTYQRLAPDLTALNGLARPYDQRPRGGQLRIGSEVSFQEPDPMLIAPDLLIGSSEPLETGSGADLLNLPVSAMPRVTRLNPEWFGPEGFSEATLFSAGKVVLEAGTVLDLGPAGRLRVEAGDIFIAGAVHAPGGDIDLSARDTSEPAGVTRATGGLTLATGATLDVSGLWTNDLRSENPIAPGGESPRLPDAGQISLLAQGKGPGLGGLVLESGSALRADGGAVLSAEGRLQAGRAGTIELAVRADPLQSPYAVPLTLEGKLSAYGVGDGGTLAVQVPDLCIGDCASSPLPRLDLAPDFFRQGGFASYDLTATGGGVRLAEGVFVTLSQQNRVLDADFRTQTSGTDLRAFSSLGVLPESQRQPVDLSLRVRAETPLNQFTDAVLQTLGFLDIGQGAAILGEPGATISLLSDTRLLIDGTVSAPGGRIQAELTSGISGSRLLQFLPSQTLWLGPEARLLTPGVLIKQPDARGLLRGDLRAAGSIDLIARSGALIVEPGAFLDVRGSSATLDLFQDDGSSLQINRELVGSDSGQITLQAAESILFGGQMAAGAALPGVRAGSLSIVLDAQRRNDNLELSAAALGLPQGTRELRIAESFEAVIPEGFLPGRALPAALNGVGLVSESQLAEGGFGEIFLQARNLSRDGRTVAPGVISFAGDITLAASRSITLAAASLFGAEAQLELVAPRLILGNPDNNSDNRHRAPQAVKTTVSTGDGSLHARAGLIDLVGNWALDGWRNAHFDSEGDIRFSGVQVLSKADGTIDTRGRGSLLSSANLLFTADQSYPVTLTDYVVSTFDQINGNIAFATGAGADSARASVLSAGGNLQVKAAEITQAGVLRAPMGGLSLEATRRIDFAPGSLTSTSLEGVTVPFGTIELAKDWVYLLDSPGLNRPRLVFTPQANRGVDPFPEPVLSLSAPTVNLSAGAQVDLSGGGDLQAYEFLPGLLGSRDVLAVDGSFAVLPALASAWTPLDPQELRGFGYAVGTTAQLSAGAQGLLSGTYAVLPAHYALLPGAFLVTPVSGYQDMAAGASRELPGKGTVVSGRFGYASSLEADARSGGFLIRSAESVAGLGDFRLTLASDFNGLQDAFRPQDAGTLQIAASTELELAANLSAIAAGNGLASRLEISADQLAVTASGRQAADGFLALDASQLNSFGAGRLFLGGTTEGGRNDRVVTLRAREVRLENEATLAAPSISLGALERVVLEEGSTLEAAGSEGSTVEDALSLVGDGALLNVSAGGGTRLHRSGEAGVQGTLEIRAGSRLISPAFTLLDASALSLLDGNLELAGVLGLGAPQITLGDGGVNASGAVLSQALLDGLALNRLVLASRSAITVSGTVDLGVERLTLETPGLLSSGTGPAGTVLQANRVDLIALGSPVAPLVEQPDASGTITLAAEEIHLAGSDDASFDISGFSRTTLAAEAFLRGEGSASLRTQGDLTLEVGLLTAATGASTGLQATGQFSLTGGAAQAVPTSTPAMGLGAALRVLADGIAVDGRIVMTAGSIDLRATGVTGISLLDAASLDVSGAVVNLGAGEASAPGGALALSAEAGDIHLGSGARLDVRGRGAEGDAGSVKLLAPAGEITFDPASLLGSAEGTGRSGTLGLFAETFAAGDATGQALALLSGSGFQESLSLRLGSGDLSIAAADRITARNVALVADDGDIDIAGWIDTGGKSGAVTLSAAEQVRLRGTARIDASATGEGGRVFLETAAASDGQEAVGGLFLQAGSVIDVSGELGGEVTLRLPQASALSLLSSGGGGPLLQLAGLVDGASRIIVEGFRAYTDDTITAPDVLADAGNARFADAAAFMQSAGAMRTALGIAANDPIFQIRPGVEIRGIGDGVGNLAVDAIWDLSSWVFAGQPGNLTLRAAGNLAVNESISDGFDGTADLSQKSAAGRALRCTDPENCGVRPNAAPKLLTRESWSYRLVAGSDLSSASSAATLLTLDGTGDLVLAPGVGSTANPGNDNIPVARPILNAIRTGTGSIELHAAGDITLGNRAAVVYTAGRDRGNGIRLGNSAGQRGRAFLGNRPYPEEGGDVRISAGGDINGVDPELTYDDNPFEFPRQLVSSWLVRQGNVDNRANRATGWTVAHEYFEQGIGALGGGNLEATAIGNFYNLSLSIPSIGQQIGGRTAELSKVKITGGGLLTATAGGDILGGVYYVGAGSAALSAGGSLGAGRPAAPFFDLPLNPVLAIGDARFDVIARGDLELSAMVNPTFIPQGPHQKQFTDTDRNSYFLSYGSASAVVLGSITGNLRLRDTTELLVGAFEPDFSQEIDNSTLQLLAPSLDMIAYTGDVLIDGDYTLAPARNAGLSLLAAGNILLNRALVLSDVSALPGIESPRAFNDFQSAGALVAKLNPESLRSAATAANVLSSQPIHSDSTQGRVLFATRDGDIQGGEGALLFLARAAELNAGRDLVNLDVIIQNLDADDVSLISAGRNLFYQTPRLPVDTRIGSAGAVLSTSNTINVWGPGRLVVTTGQGLDLGTAGGVLSRGSTLNAALPGIGASLSLFAGLGSAGLDFDSFVEAYFTAGAPYADAVAQYMRDLTGDSDLTEEQALVGFRALSGADQTELVLSTFFSELRETGRVAAVSTGPSYARGDAAIKALFPAENYAGGMDLFFSQIFTVAGGDIELLAPGGAINVGLATPPSSFGIAKRPSELGIATLSEGNVQAFLRDDFNVNESRVFAADGGDILVWSNLGDIDAGRGARSAISVPANQFQFDNQGRVKLTVPPPIQGSGIRAFTTTPGRKFGDTDLVTPRGVVNASEAGIESAGNITIAAVAVLGAENIKAGGAAVGVPSANVGVVGAGVAGAAGAANAASRSAVDSSSGAGRANDATSGLGGASVSFISVDFLGFGDEEDEG